MASERQPAETYLRLMAETELRLALALPRVREPRALQAIFGPAVQRAFIARATIAAVSSTRSVRGRIRRLALGRFGRALAAMAMERSRHRQSVEAGLLRLRTAAEALAAVDALGEHVARTIVSNYEKALLLRQRLSGPSQFMRTSATTVRPQALLPGRSEPSGWHPERRPRRGPRPLCLASLSRLAGPC